MPSVNVFYAPELENPPLAPECSITFTTIGAAPGETTAVRIRDGINKVDEDEWEQIQQKDYAQTLLQLGALRVMKPDEVKEVLSKDDLKTPEDVTITDLKIADAVKVITSTNDLQRLDAWLQDELRNPVRQAITRRINTLTGGE